MDLLSHPLMDLLCLQKWMQHPFPKNSQHLKPNQFPILLHLVAVAIHNAHLAANSLYVSNTTFAGKMAGLMHLTISSQRDELLAIHADHVYPHFKDKVYGNPDADEGSTPPLRFRLHFVLAWKRKISYFMPSTQQQWNDARQEGNPCSVQMSPLTKAMRRFQMQCHGVESSVRQSPNEK